ncbi:phosphopantetheine-binding protein [Rhizobium ruizarguesonis]
MSQTFTTVKTMLAKYSETPIDDFDMSDDLDLTYDMDSTELTELAQQLAQRYNIIIAKSDRADWRTGNDIVAFVNRASSNAAFSIAGE